MDVLHVTNGSGRSREVPILLPLSYLFDNPISYPSQSIRTKTLGFATDVLWNMYENNMNAY